MLDITERDGTLFLRVRLQPKASANALAGEFKGGLKVKVTAAPERGKANRAAIIFLAGLIGVKRSAIRLVHGERSRNKLFSVSGLRRDELLGRLGLPRCPEDPGLARG